jgi:hypothetical protein
MIQKAVIPECLNPESRQINPGMSLTVVIPANDMPG